MVANALTINWHGSTAERNDRRPFKLERGTAEVSSPYHTLTIDESFNLFLTNAQVEELRTLLNLYHGDDKIPTVAEALADAEKTALRTGIVGYEQEVIDRRDEQIKEYGL